MSVSSKPVTSGRLLARPGDVYWIYAGRYGLTFGGSSGFAGSLRISLGMALGHSVGVVMAIAAAVVGSLFLCTGELIARRSRRTQEKRIQNDASRRKGT